MRLRSARLSDVLLADHRVRPRLYIHQGSADDRATLDSRILFLPLPRMVRRSPQRTWLAHHSVVHLGRRRLADCRSPPTRCLPTALRLPNAMCVRRIPVFGTTQRMGDLQRPFDRHHGYCDGAEQQCCRHQSGHCSVDLEANGSPQRVSDGQLCLRSLLICNSHHRCVFEAEVRPNEFGWHQGCAWGYQGVAVISCVNSQVTTWCALVVRCSRMYVRYRSIRTVVQYIKPGSRPLVSGLGRGYYR